MDNTTENTEIVEVPETATPEGAVEKAKEAIKSFGAIIKEEVDDLLIGLSLTGEQLADLAFALLDASKLVTDLEAGKFTTKSSLNGACKDARADVLAVIERLKKIRQGGEFIESFDLVDGEPVPVMLDETTQAVDEETGELVFKTPKVRANVVATTYGGFMALRDEAMPAVEKANRAAAIAAKKAAIEKQNAELAELLKLEEADGVA